ncbi:TIM barrel protein [Paenibacillus ferrarius]|uniref:TIM barrel protein n=1 Tax=Paenibacillus ferrarius TaxID=1469647 RepID=UPI003D26E8E3
MKRLEQCLEVGLVHGGLFPQASRDTRILYDSIELIAQDPFFERIELGPIQDGTARKIVRRLTETAKLKVSYLAQPLIFQEKIDLQSQDESIRQQGIQRVKSWIEEAQQLGADQIAIISGPNDVEQEDTALHRLADSIIQLEEETRACSLQLLLELFDSDKDKRRFIGSTNRARHLMNLVEAYAPTFRLKIDLSHIPLLDESIQSTVFPLQQWIGHVHIGNTVVAREDSRYGDSHPYFGYPAGSHDSQEVADFLRALRHTGYIYDSRKASLSIETIAAQDERASLLIANAKRTLMQAWEKLEEDEHA